MLLKVVAVGLLGADLAEHDRVDRFEVRGVGDQRHMDADPVELAVGAGAEVIFHVARPADIVGVGRTTGEFMKDHAIGLGHHVGEHVEAAAMRHAVHDLAHAILAAVLDDRLHRGDHRFTAVEAEALGPDILLAEELFPLLGFDHLGQDRLLAIGREFDRLVLALEPLLQEAAFLDIGDVHIFEADIAAIVAAQDRDQLADRRLFEAEIAAEEDRPIHIGVGESVIFGRQVGGQFLLRQAKRVEIGGEMAAHAIGADQQHRADRIIRRSGNVGGRCSGGRSRRRSGGAAARRLGRGLHLGRVERGGQRVGVLERPARIGPARAGRGAFQPREPLTPAILDRSGVRLELRIHRLDERGAHASGDIREIQPINAHHLCPSTPGEWPGRALRAPGREWCVSPSTLQAAFRRAGWVTARRGCPLPPSPRSCSRHRPCRPTRSRRHGPCGGPEGRCGPR